MARRRPENKPTDPAADILRRLEAAGATKVKVAITDIDGVLRGKYVHVDKFRSALQSGFGFCNVVFGWDMADVCYDNTPYTGWHTGYPDAAVRLDVTTERRVPWDGGVPFFLGEFVDAKGGSLPVCPRQVLRRVLARLARAGFSARMAAEYEWFNFRETPQTLAAKGFHDPQPITPGMFGYSVMRMGENREFANALHDELGAFGVPIEGLHTETGPGVYEAAILHSDPLTAADRAVLFKAGVKDIARRFGIIPSFMARWSASLPGCGGHLHQSLWDADGKKNLFHDARDGHRMSRLFKHYLAGQVALLPELLPLFAPTVNSYKRLVEGAWAPTRASWGVDNRTVALRVIPGSEKSTRLETRAAGSDVNPYLGIAAALAAGLYGIENKLDLPASVVGSGYADKKAQSLPTSLDEATTRFERSAAARDLFGAAFVDHFVATRRWEWRQWRRAVTNWELQRYFEII